MIVNGIKRLTALLCSACFLAPAAALTVSAEELASYTAYDSYQKETQPTDSPWRFQVGYASGSGYVYEDLPWNAEENRWGNLDVGIIDAAESDLVTGLPALYVHPGGQRMPTVTFIAPRSGTVEISLANGGVYAPLNGAAQNYDGVNLYVYQSRTELFSATGISANNLNPEEARVFSDTITVNVRENERIRFVLTPNTNTDNDSTYFNPQVVYTAYSDEAPAGEDTGTPVPGGGDTPAPPDNPDTPENPNEPDEPVQPTDGVYSFSKMFGNWTDPWFYYWYNGGVYYPLIWNNGQFDGTEDGAPHAIVANGYMHPAPTGVTAIAFKVPESGRVKIGMEDTLILGSPAESVDGTIVSVISDGELLCDQYWLTSENPSYVFEPVELEVYEGQIIYFYLSKAITNAGDSTRVLPYVEYLDYHEVEAPATTTSTVPTTSGGGAAPTTAAGDDVSDTEPAGNQAGAPAWVMILLGILTPVVIVGAVCVVIVLRRRKATGTESEG